MLQILLVDYKKYIHDCETVPAMTTSPCWICFNMLTEEDELVLYKTLQADWDVLPRITGNIFSFWRIRVYMKWFLIESCGDEGTLPMLLSNNIDFPTCTHAKHTLDS